ncbi:fused MFS/spermidine synthase [Chloroflexota bacterium]
MADKNKTDRRSRLYQLPRRHRPPKDLVKISKTVGIAALRFMGRNLNLVDGVRNNWNLRGFILLCFFFAGMASLMDQVLWMRQLGLIFGTTMEAVSTVLAVFMAGLALGSYLFGKMADKTKSPLRLYAVLQMGIGAYVMLTPLIFMGLNSAQVSIYASLPVGSAGVTVLRVLLAFLVLIVPTTLMGGTLPVIAKYFVRRQDELGGGIGNLYFINTLGAVLGAFLAGFLLIPYIGVLASTILAASIDFSVGVIFFLLQRYKLKHVEEPEREQVAAETPIQLNKKQQKRLEREERKRERLRSPSYSRAVKWVVFAGFAFGGLASLSLEVSWTRVLSMVLGSSVYAFSLMLTAFLLGIALGSAIASKFVDRLRHLWVHFFIVMGLIGVAVLVLNPLLGELPLLFVRVFSNVQQNFWLLQFVQFMLLLLIMLVPTLLMGAAFPIAAKIYADDMEHMGGSVGRLYAGNTLGSMAGPLLTGFIIIPLIGMQWSISLVSIIYTVIAGAVFIIGFGPRLRWPNMAPFWAFVLANARPKCLLKGIVKSPMALWWVLLNPIRFAVAVGRGVARISVGLAAITVLGVLLASILIPVLGSWDRRMLNSGVFLYSNNYYQGAGSIIDRVRGSDQLVFYDEGLMATVAVYDRIDGDRALTIDGKTDATSFGDLPTELISGHLPMLLHDNPEEVLLIGLGSGITLGGVELYPSLIEVEAVELEGAVIEAAKTYFSQANNDALIHPKLNLIQADARNYVLAQTRTDKKYDVITAEPSNPWMAGNSNLFTREQFELYKQVLDDDGVICQWIHYYSMSIDDLKTVFSTFTDVFPDATLWRTKSDLLLIGTKSEQVIDFAALNERVQQEDVEADLKRMDIDDVYDVLGRFVMGPTALAEFSEGAALHTDNHPILQFSAPKNLYIDTNLMDNAVRLQFAAEKIEEADSLLINYEDEADFLQEIQKQRAFFTHFTHVVVSSQKALASQEKQLESDQKALALQQKALASQERGDYEEAEKYAVAANEYRDEALEYRDEALEYGNEAFAANEAILNTGANDAYAHRRLGSIHLTRGELDDALTHMEQSVALNATDALTWFDLADIYSRFHRFEDAVDSYSSAIDLTGGNGFIYLGRGQAYMDVGNLDAAIEDFSRFIDAYPGDDGDETAYAYRGLAYATRGGEGDAGSALSDIDRALKINPRQAMVYANSGRIYYEMGQDTEEAGDVAEAESYYNMAIAEYEQAISINPDLAEAYLHLAITHHTIGGETNRAIAAQKMTEALTKDSYDLDAWYYQGLIWMTIIDDYPDYPSVFSEGLAGFEVVLDRAPGSALADKAVVALNDTIADFSEDLPADPNDDAAIPIYQDRAEVYGLLYSAVGDENHLQLALDDLVAVVELTTESEVSQEAASVAAGIIIDINENLPENPDDAVADDSSTYYQRGRAHGITYQVFENAQAKESSIEDFLKANELLPGTELAQKARTAVDELVDWGNLTEEDRPMLESIVASAPGTTLGQKAQDALDVL